MSDPTPLTPRQRRTLAALMDTYLPALKGRPDPHGFFATSASDTGAPAAAEALIAELPRADRAGLLELLDGLAFFSRLHRAPLKVREGVLNAVAARNARAAGGLTALRRLTLMLGYAVTDGQGRNPFWPQFGYSGPLGAEARTTPDLPNTEPEDGAVLTADVVVIGSGAGGGVIAGELSARGLKVTVLEAGRQYPDADLGRSELWAYRHLYWRGGPAATADGNVSLLAGQTVGGGTTVNWMNCVRTPPEVREEWARAGLRGLDTAEFDGHLDAVMRRLQANNECSEFNGTHQRMIEGAMRLGYSFQRAYRNADPRLHDPRHAGHCGFGDATGSKQSTARTYLKDALERGATLIEGAAAGRILTAGGHATGVEVTLHTRTGERRHFTVRAPQVVVAGGALETPALLRRSGIGGPAVGEFLHLHPCGAVVGVFDHDQQNWWGATQGAIVDEFGGRRDGYGYLIETIQYTTGLSAAASAWQDAVTHKERMARHANTVTLIHLTRDRGSGRVTLDEGGQARVTYSVSDPLDVENFFHGQASVARLLATAGAHTIYTLHDRAAPWHAGQDLEARLREWRALPLGAGGHAVFSAHQMGTARMGLDPATSVAGPEGELHDIQGVWVGDTSAFPTSSGANPMITCMALARRTAQFIAAKASVGQLT
ncbi:GMC family oxidoreductase [Deinococcus metallilatus]|uniref:Choline dehydrogenase-like flavoprotein n=1 Tax=Deinococcus metallilatus TaxID=1211322 RepID=A0AAJ5JYH7_9DEIO|nr:GMC family oxidoreductase [Deinococcus metallilatus]MBB5295519.1 choline dehydrogenase-like flavoprotein [Deinococcus metallilatus]QBY07967.1 GMC family oxidoreductase [Deinococcus metallilatus]RXJ12860.1 GMC family oxidoreductase [Deinococcus metallilatus]TLK27218.1 GMC family oxidoreductase [Deinococcus metallilatus]GMA16197.1 GMC oxidoreductase [Deinococcus metallilatus]